MGKKANKIALIDELIRLQLETVDKGIEEVDNDKFWFSSNQFTNEQYDEFKSYAVNAIMDKLKLSRYRAERFFYRFYLDYGLKIREDGI